MATHDTCTVTALTPQGSVPMLLHANDVDTDTGQNFGYTVHGCKCDANNTSTFLLTYSATP